MILSEASGLEGEFCFVLKFFVCWFSMGFYGVSDVFFVFLKWFSMVFCVVLKFIFFLTVMCFLGFFLFLWFSMGLLFFNCFQWGIMGFLCFGLACFECFLGGSHGTRLVTKSI